MNNLKSMLVIGCLVLAVPATAEFGAPPKPPAKPAHLDILVEPDSVPAGQTATVTIGLRPIEGVKINRYPKIKLEIAGREGVHAGAMVTLGNDSPPPPDKMSTNYFTRVDLLELEIAIDGTAPSGRLELEGKLTYFYCVIESGFCAPARVPLKIPVTVR